MQDVFCTRKYLDSTRVEMEYDSETSFEVTGKTGKMYSSGRSECILYDASCLIKT
jgi:hypothetical protein